MLGSIAIILLLPVATLAINCTTAGDGNHEIGCRVFTTCLDGESTVTECRNGTVYNDAVGQCDDPVNVKPPCGQQKDCTGMPDAKFPDLDNKCRSYYTCAGETFLGHNPCPAALVFNDAEQTCDWADNVLPPCGTKGSKP